MRPSDWSTTKGLFKLLFYEVSTLDPRVVFVSVDRSQSVHFIGKGTF